MCAVVSFSPNTEIKSVLLTERDLEESGGSGEGSGDLWGYTR